MGALRWQHAFSDPVDVSRSRPAAILKATPVGLVLLLAAGLSACGWFPDRRLEQQKAAAEQQRRRQEAECRRDRQRLQPLIAAFRRSEERVAALEAEAYVPTAAPAPLDPNEQRRLAIYDQEIEQQQYDEAYAAWQNREAQRRGTWQRERQERLAQAAQQRTAAAAALRAEAPALLSATDPPQLHQADAQRRLTCGTELH
jgi:hypothetical protein